MSNRIVDVGEMHVVGLQGEFTPETTGEIAALWGKFAPRIPEIREKKKAWVKFGLGRSTPDKKLEYTAAVEVLHSDVPVPDGLKAIIVPAGPYALFNHLGHIRDIGATWKHIMDVAMKEEGYLHRNGAYDFERYDERWNPETGEGIVDIFIAIERARR